MQKLKKIYSEKDIKKILKKEDLTKQEIDEYCLNNFINMFFNEYKDLLNFYVYSDDKGNYQYNIDVPLNRIKEDSKEQFQKNTTKRFKNEDTGGKK